MCSNQLGEKQSGEACLKGVQHSKPNLMQQHWSTISNPAYTHTLAASLITAEAIWVQYPDIWTEGV